MKVSKPMKVATLFRTFEQARRPELHIAAILGFSLDAPRSLLDEMSFWGAVTPELGGSLLDEALSKPRAEVLVAGRCFAPGGRPTPASFVRAKIGEVDKRLSVIGDREWQRGVPTAPVPFVEMPVDWAHAFGGPEYELNPYGIGASPIERDGAKVHPLPNIEPHGGLLRSQGDRPAPAGLMPMDVGFGQRRKAAGTYGRDYVEKWAPGLPPDHDPQFFCLAPPDQRVGRSWALDEAFLVENMSAASPRIEGRLPNLLTRAFVHQHLADGPRFHEVELSCETIWLFPSSGVGAVIFRGRLPVRDDDAHDVTHLLLACEEPGDRRSLEHYRAARELRLDKDKGALAELGDGDLMPARSSGVVPSISLGDMGKWMKIEGLATEKSERGAARARRKAREQLLEMGADPSVLAGLDDPAPIQVPDVEDLDAVAAFLMAQREAAGPTDPDAIARRIAEDTEKAAAPHGKSAAELVGEAEPPEGGPPKFRTDEALRSMRESAVAARAQGAPALEVEAKLADGSLETELRALEARHGEAYRAFAHVSPEARPMPEATSQLARAFVQAARDGGESLAERDFTGADLRGLSLAGMDLRRALLECADLREADLSDAILEGAVLARADLRGANLRGAKLGAANLGRANLEKLSLEDADLSRAILAGARVVGASFARSDFTGADVTEVDWRGVDLRGANFEQTTFLKANLSGTNLAGARLAQTTFIECTLDATDFSDADLHKATFVMSKGKGARFTRARATESVFAHQDELPEADFTEALLEPCCLRTTNFAGSRFDRATMRMADLSECDLSRCTFDGAALTGALFIRANLDGASLRTANLLEANFTKSTVKGADFTGAQLVRADFTRSSGDTRTRFTDAVVTWAKFDQEPRERR